MSARKRRGGWSWGPVDGAKLRVLSLGAGVESTTMALMAAHGEIGPMPDCAIFADTGDELRATMDHLDWLSSGNVLPFKVHRVSIGKRLSDEIRQRARGDEAGRKGFVSAPFYTGNGGMGRRQCTREFKIEAIKKEQRRLMGFKARQRIPAGSCEIWIGIATDEVIRAGAAYDAWAVNRYPLLQAGMSRGDCIQWLRRNDYPVPPNSACVFCPFLSNADRRWMRDNEPESHQAAIDIDRVIRPTAEKHGGQFVHRSRVPLEDVDLSTPEDRGQANFLNDCEGFCGV